MKRKIVFYKNFYFMIIAGLYFIIFSVLIGCKKQSYPPTINTPPYKNFIIVVYCKLRHPNLLRSYRITLIEAAGVEQVTHLKVLHCNNSKLN